MEIEISLELNNDQGNITLLQITPHIIDTLVNCVCVCVRLSERFNFNNCKLISSWELPCACFGICIVWVCMCGQPYRFKIHRNPQTILYPFAYLCSRYIKHDWPDLSLPPISHIQSKFKPKRWHPHRCNYYIYSTNVSGHPPVFNMCILNWYLSCIQVSVSFYMLILLFVIISKYLVCALCTKRIVKSYFSPSGFHGFNWPFSSNLGKSECHSTRWYFVISNPRQFHRVPSWQEASAQSSRTEITHPV